MQQPVQYVMSQPRAVQYVQAPAQQVHPYPFRCSTQILSGP
jgi:hypothetical protein